MWQGGHVRDMHGGGCPFQGRAWQGGMCGRGDMHDGGCAWQERWPLKRAGRIPLECILVMYLPIHCIPFASDIALSFQ